MAYAVADLKDGFCNVFAASLFFLVNAYCVYQDFPRIHTCR